YQARMTKVEGALVREKEAFFASRRNRDFVALRLEAFAQRVRDLLFVLDNQNAHGVLPFESCSHRHYRRGSQVLQRSSQKFQKVFSGGTLRDDQDQAVDRRARTAAKRVRATDRMELLAR